MMGREIELYSPQEEIDQRGPARTPTGTDTDNLNWQNDNVEVTASWGCHHEPPLCLARLCSANGYGATVTVASARWFAQDSKFEFPGS
jgi:hypothetical protein